VNQTIHNTEEHINQSNITGQSADSVLMADKLVFYNIQFVKAKAVILTKSAQALKDLVTIMKSHPTLGIRIEGHTEMSGMNWHWFIYQKTEQPL
jgi:outer membrane protein OmpA-like peptidoglycan-associated protein